MVRLSMLTSTCWKTGDEVKDIVDRFHAVERKSKNEPLSWIDENSNMPAWFGYAHLRAIAFSALYSPMVMFPVLASIVSNLEEGVIDNMMKLIAGNSPYFNSQPFCVAPGLSLLHGPDDGTLTVMCGDKRYPVGASLPWT